MILLDFAWEGKQVHFDALREQLAQQGFHLGGNWTYEQGMLDKALDAEKMHWLRIPIVTVRGQLDADSRRTDAVVQIGKPCVLNHIYRKGVDQTAEASVLGALVDQFQSPANPDAELDEQWIAEGRRELEEVARAIFKFL